MKVPKTTRRHCPYCKKHTDMKVVNQKNKGLNKTHTMTHGSKTRTKLRGLRSGAGNHGRFSRKAISQWGMTGAKSSKKTDLRYTCTTCKKTHMQRKGTRTKKLEMVDIK